MESTGRSDELIVCGGDEVFVLDLRGWPGAAPQRAWSWRARQRPELPEPARGRFGSTDECKPVPGGQVLLSSSGGVVALVERASGRAGFWALAANAHSAEVLPGGRVVIAASHADGGDRILLYDLDAPNALLDQDELAWAHGVVWDESRETLWAVGSTELRGYRLHAWDTDSPSLQRTDEIRLPDTWGHDLYPVPDSSLLMLTTGRGVWLFDPDRRSFLPHPELAHLAAVKSICIHPTTGRLAYVQADDDHWWSERIQFLNPRGALHLPGQRLYKARWAAGCAGEFGG